MIPFDPHNPRIIARVNFWWERNLVRILRKGGQHAQELRELVAPVETDKRLGDLIYPTT